MTFERWLIVALITGFVVDRLFDRTQKHLTRENASDRERQQEDKRDSQYVAGVRDGIKLAGEEHARQHGET